MLGDLVVPLGLLVWWMVVNLVGCFIVVWCIRSCVIAVICGEIGGVFRL